MTHDRTDVYTRITAEIVAAIEAGAGLFRMPWHHNGTSTARPANIASGKGYRGVNVLALWVAAEIARYDNGLWGTYRQWRALEAQVRKGEHGTTVVLWKEVTPAGDDDRKGRKDRNAMPSPQLLELLRDWWRDGRRLGVLLPWGWLFPGRNPVVPLSTRQLNRAVHATNLALAARGGRKRVVG